MQSGEGERGKFDLITILHFDRLPEKIELFAWWHLFGLSKVSFSKKKLSTTDLPLRFCKIGLRNILFIFGRKMVVGFVLFVCFVANLSDFGLL